MKTVSEGFISQEPLHYKGILYFSKFCMFETTDEFEEEKVQIPDLSDELPKETELRRHVNFYTKLILGTNFDQEMYIYACNSKFNKDYSYVTKEEVRLQVRQLDRKHLLNKYLD